jgi:diguanylate cyclase (GGDEF)-like protein
MSKPTAPDWNSRITDTTDGRSMSIINLPIAEGGWVVTHEDITDVVRAERQLEHLALHDPLTNLPNRTFFRRRLDEALQKPSATSFLAVMVLDLDNFKAINDTFGHPTGDDLLKMLGNRLRAVVDDTDMLARLGGDEFAIVQNLTNEAQATELAARITSAVTEPFLLNSRPITTSFSFGVAIAPRHGLDPDRLLKNADLALYASKAAGRGRCFLFTEEMDAVAGSLHQLEMELKQAVRDGAFELHYQPLISLGTSQICGYEALARWRHPTRGLVQPGEFIALAEELGLIEEIGEFALAEACRAATAWPDDLTVAVNLSAVQLRREGFAIAVDAVLRDTGLTPSRLELELTEQSLARETPVLQENLRFLRKLGVRLVMDDFGVGYCSLNYLRRFPFDKIKIDRSFIASIPAEAEATAIVGAVVALGRALGMATVAEGVETELQLDAVRSLGCAQAQGFLIGRPSAIPLGLEASRLGKAVA